MVLNPQLWQAKFGMSPYSVQQTPNNPMVGGRTPDPRAPLASLYPASAGPTGMAAASQRLYPAGVFVTPNEPQGGVVTPGQSGGGVTTREPIPQASPYMAQLARSMMGAGASTAPVMSPVEGIARTLTGALGGYFAGQANEAQRAREAAQTAQLAELFGLTEEQAASLPMEVIGDVAGMRAAEAEAVTEAAKEGFKEERDLRKEYQALSKDFRTQRDAFQRVMASADRPTPAGDLALIFNYMKVLDPGSVVRESEFATAAQTGAFGERIKGAVQRVVSGERLTPAQRADFLSRASNLYGNAVSTQRGREDVYRELATSYGRDPERAVPDYVRDVEPITTEEAIEIAGGDPLIEQPNLRESLQEVRATLGGGGGGEITPRPTTAEEYEKIPSGTKYQHPDDPVGELRTKK